MAPFGARPYFSNPPDATRQQTAHPLFFAAQVLCGNIRFHVLLSYVVATRQ